MKTIDKARQAARETYAWPGGYQLMALVADGECVCPECLKREWKQVARATKAKLSDWPDTQWRVEDIFVNWEGPSITCAHCNKEFQSEYGEVE